MTGSFTQSKVCDSSLHSASQRQKLVNSTDVNKMKIMNEMDRLPLVVFPSILSLSKNNILYLNSKLYSDGTKQHRNNRKENMYKHPQKHLALAQQDLKIREKKQGRTLNSSEIVEHPFYREPQVPRTN